MSTRPANQIIQEVEKMEQKLNLFGNQEQAAELAKRINEVNQTVTRAYNFEIESRA